MSTATSTRSSRSCLSDEELGSLLLLLSFMGAAYYLGYKRGRRIGHHDLVLGLERAQRIIHSMNK